jgi:hypothetical protein
VGTLTLLIEPCALTLSAGAFALKFGGCPSKSGISSNFALETGS